MEAKETYYEILGIEANAAEDDIRKAYRKLGMKHLWNINFDSQIYFDWFSWIY